MSAFFIHPPAWLVASMQGEGFGIDDGQATAAADGAAAVMLGLIFFVIGMLAVFAWNIRRRAHRPNPTLEFLERLEDEPEMGPTVGTTPSSPEDWERPPDWWKHR